MHKYMYIYLRCTRVCVFAPSAYSYKAQTFQSGSKCHFQHKGCINQFTNDARGAIAGSNGSHHMDNSIVYTQMLRYICIYLSIYINKWNSK